MENCLINRVEKMDCKNMNGQIDRYRILVEFNAENSKPFRMTVLSAGLKDNNGTELPAFDKSRFPVGIINHTRPKFYFQSNGEPLPDESFFSIAIRDPENEKPLRFQYIFENGIGKLNKIECWDGVQINGSHGDGSL